MTVKNFVSQEFLSISNMKHSQKFKFNYKQFFANIILIFFLYLYLRFVVAISYVAVVQTVSH